MLRLNFGGIKLKFGLSPAVNSVLDEWMIDVLNLNFTELSVIVFRI